MNPASIRFEYVAAAAVAGIQHDAVLRCARTTIGLSGVPDANRKRRRSKRHWQA